MDIRPLTAADATAYWHFRLEALETETDAFGASAEEHRATSIDDVATRLASDMANNFVLGAFVDGALVGTAGFYRSKNVKERHKGHVWGVYVTAALCGNGIGRSRYFRCGLGRVAASAVSLRNSSSEYDRRRLRSGAEGLSVSSS